MHLPKAKSMSHMPRLCSLARLQLLLLILLRCRLCAARNDPGGRLAAGVHLSTWKLCLLVAALAVATVALLAALLFFACRRRNQNALVAVAVAPAPQDQNASVAVAVAVTAAPQDQSASVAVAVAVAPAPQNREKKGVDDKPNWWSTHLRPSTSRRNPKSINPTMVPSPSRFSWFSPTASPPTSSAASMPIRPASSSTSTIEVPRFGEWSSASSSPPTSQPTAPAPGPARRAASDERASASPSRRSHSRQWAHNWSPLRSVPPAPAPAPVQANRKQQTRIKDPLACYSPALSVLLPDLPYDLLESATNGFKRKSLPGRRVGPWDVFVLEDTHQFVEENGLPAKVTIKRHRSAFTEEDCKRIREELKCMCTLRHKNLVKLHGYTFGKGRLYLVYDYMPNGSLENRLFPVNGATDLNWLARYRIAKEVAQGLDPLHVSNTPHGSISLSSIMFDYDNNVRLDDHFYYRPDKSSSSRAVATAEKSEASLEADIADLGAVFLELVCGRRRTDTNFSENGTTTTLVDWVWALYGEAYKEPEDLSDDLQLQRRVNEDRLFGAVDRTLDGEIVKAEASKLLILGLACNHPDSKQRLKIRDVRNVLLDKDPVPELPLSKPQL